MISLIAFRRVVTPIYTHTLRLPDAPQGQQAAQELATLPDGRTVVVLFDENTLPTNQPEQISDSIEVLPTPLPADLRDAIRTASPQIALINRNVQAAIAQRYSMADEIKLMRTAPSPEMEAYNAYAEDCRAWGRAEKAKLGL